MKWGTAKTILIYIFVIVNIFLFTIYKLNTSRERTSSFENVATVLKNYGISADKDAFTSLPEKTDRLEAVNRVANQDFAKNFFEKTPVKDNRDNYHTKNEKLIINGISFEYSNSAPNLSEFSGITKRNAASKTIKYLKKRGGIESRMKADGITSGKDGSFTVDIIYNYKGIPVFSGNIKVRANNKGVLSVKGKILEFNGIKNRYYNTVSGQAAFIDYLSYYGKYIEKEKKIKNFRYGYYISPEPESVSSYAIPAYEAEFTDGSLVYIDGRVDIESEFRLLGP